MTFLNDGFHLFYRTHKTRNVVHIRTMNTFVFGTDIILEEKNLSFVILRNLDEYFSR